jgi:protein-L-isoaspartate O-methyltransferase
VDTVTEPGSGQWAARLAGDLERRGLLTDPRWREALREVPRHMFVPSVAWAVSDKPGGGGWRIDAASDPEGWWEAVYSDSSIIIQVDDGAGDPASGQGRATSSVSAPGSAISFLELLDPRPNDRVLEIGTGSGWTAALLCHACGDGHVASVEVDPALSGQAAANVAALGYSPRLLTGDGVGGAPAGVPYDRIHVTCGVADIPRAWLAQARPGGMIVVPWAPNRTAGYKLRLTVVDGPAAVGTFHGPGRYTMLRTQRSAVRRILRHAGQADISSARLDPRSVTDGGEGAQLAIVARVPGISSHMVREQDGTASLLLYETGDPDGSWAACDYEPGTTDFRVSQYGARRLWDEVVSAYMFWLRSGSPGRERFGITIDSDATCIWLDHPQNIIGEPVPRRFRRPA